MKTSNKYPNIWAWVQDGRIEIGYNDYTDAFLYAMDEGGVIWESNKRYASLDEALADLDAGIAAWCEENGIVFSDDEIT